VEDFLGAIGPILQSTVRNATPLVFAALGGLFSERSGVVNIGLEGLMLIAAFAGVAGAHFSGSALVGLATALAAGLFFALIHALMCVTFEADQIISGTAINLLALGGTGFLMVVIFGAGGVGSNAVQGARYAGAKNVIVIDPVDFKREMATVFGATHTFASAKEAHEFVVETTWGQLADHAILTPGVVTEEMVNAAVQMTGKGGKVTITAVGHLNEKAVHFHAGMLIGYQRQVRGALFGDCNPLSDIPKLLGLCRAGDLKLDEVNEAYADLDAGKNIRGVIVHED